MIQSLLNLIIVPRQCYLRWLLNINWCDAIRKCVLEKVKKNMAITLIASGLIGLILKHY